MYFTVEVYLAILKYLRKRLIIIHQRKETKYSHNNIIALIEPLQRAFHKFFFSFC